jgi:acyl carrier protein
MSESVTEIESDVRELLLRMLRLADDAHRDIARERIDQWDSLKHMEIVFALEDRYDVRFDESEFSELDSPAAIARAVRRHLAA